MKINPQKNLVLGALILILIFGAFWILREGSKINEGKDGGMTPAIKQRANVRANVPYQLTETSWENSGDLEHLRHRSGTSSPLQGLAVAGQ